VTFYGKAGVPLSAADVESRARRRRARAEQSRVIVAKHTAEAADRWARGLVKPYRITTALDACGLDGPQVDVACGATEPEVDWWEAGYLYPTWEQVCLLAELCGVTPGFLAFDASADLDGPMFMCGPRKCDVVEPAERILEFDLDTVAACPGTRPTRPARGVVVPLTGAR